MLQNAYLVAKIGADTAENEQHFAEILPIGRRVADRHHDAPAATATSGVTVVSAAAEASSARDAIMRGLRSVPEPSVHSSRGPRSTMQQKSTPEPCSKLRSLLRKC